MNPKQRLLVALDFSSADEVMYMARLLADEVGGYKIGLAAFTSGGPELVRRVREVGLPIFLDLKLHDIPNTVAGAAAEIGRMGVAMTTAHSMGGAEMLAAAREAARSAALEAGHEPPLILAVTVLTSMSANDLMKVGVITPPESEVRLLASLAAGAGADGVVCSAWEAREVRAAVGARLRVVTPGIRPEGDDRDDQKRIATPRDAIRSGADMIVVGRPITRSPDPIAASRSIVAQIEAALGDTPG